jgi:hypothetical protein
MERQEVLLFLGFRRKKSIALCAAPKDVKALRRYRATKRWSTLLTQNKIGYNGARDSAVRVHDGSICAHDAWYVHVDTQVAHDGAECAHYGALSARDGARRAHDGASDSHDGACDAEKALGAGAAVVAIKVGGEALAAARR